MESEDRKTRLLAEARELKVPHDPSWSADQLELVVAKKRVKAKPEPKLAPPVEEGDDESAAMRVLELEAALSAEMDTVNVLRGELTSAKDEIARLSEKLKVSNETVFNLESAKSAVETQLFDLQAKGAGVTENAKATEDFGGPKEAAAPRVAKVSAQGLVRCKVTKAGAGKIFTGNGGEMFERDAIAEFPAETVAALEEKGWVESD